MNSRFVRPLCRIVTVRPTSSGRAEPPSRPTSCQVGAGLYDLSVVFLRFARPLSRSSDFLRLARPLVRSVLLRSTSPEVGSLLRSARPSVRTVLFGLSPRSTSQTSLGVVAELFPTRPTSLDVKVVSSFPLRPSSLGPSSRGR